MVRIAKLYMFKNALCVLQHQRVRRACQQWNKKFSAVAKNIVLSFASSLNVAFKSWDISQCKSRNSRICLNWQQKMTSKTPSILNEKLFQVTEESSDGKIKAKCCFCLASKPSLSGSKKHQIFCCIWNGSIQQKLENLKIKESTSRWFSGNTENYAKNPTSIS